MARRSSRRGERDTRRGSTIKRLPWRQLRNTRAPVEVLSADEVEAIHRASLRVLAEAGLRVADREARDLLAAAGAEVDRAEEIVRFDPALIEEQIGKAPASFTIAARNPAKSITVGGNCINFVPVGGPSFVSDLDRGRRAGTMAELTDFTKLIQAFDVIHAAGVSSFEPLDLPAESRHLDSYYAAIRYTDKVWSSWLLGAGRAEDALQMCAIIHGIDREDLPKQPLVYGNINTNSPRLLDGPMAQGLLTFARARQPVVVTPFTLSGAMAPATVAGALVEQNAEALAGIALAQVASPGCPVVYGGFTSNVDMKSGAPAFGTPEQTKATHATGQLCRRYGLPFRSSNTNASNCVDAQSAYESEMSLWGAVMGHANFVFHAAGWLEGGLTASFEKLVIDAEMLQMMAAYLDPLTIDEDSLAVEAILETPPAGHFFGSSHTLARYETAFYAPVVSDWRNYETWRDGGSRTAAERANVIWKQLLQEYEAPPLDPAVDEALLAYIAKRKEELAGAEAIAR